MAWAQGPEIGDKHSLKTAKTVLMSNTGRQTWA
jgi:hypothetical protein